MHGGLGRRGCEKGDQDIHGEDDDAYGCCGQALTRFTAVPPAGPDRPLQESVCILVEVGQRYTRSSWLLTLNRLSRLWKMPGGPLRLHDDDF